MCSAGLGRVLLASADVIWLAQSASKAARIDAQDLAQQVGEVLRVTASRMPRTEVVGAAAVAERDVQVASAAERKRAAFVFELRLVDAQQHTRRVGVHGDRLCGMAAI